uniref:Uncharacterized protein n=1 Tax=Rhizophora mucronata TaxID=61149 RepID=A0A2P2MYX0_RHIMU
MQSNHYCFGLTHNCKKIVVSTRVELSPSFSLLANFFHEMFKSCIFPM